VTGDRDQKRAVLNCGWGQGTEESCFELWLGTGTRGELFRTVTGDRDQKRAILNCNWGQGPDESCFEL